MQKGRVRNEHRMAWRQGLIDQIPDEGLKVLEADYAEEKGIDSKPKESKVKESDKK